MRTAFGLLVCLGFVLIGFGVSANAQKMKPEEIVAKHLDSIGTAEAREKVKTRMIIGNATVTFRSQKNLQAFGRVVVASTNERSFFGITLNASDYPGERFSYDGSKAKVANALPGQRSFFGNFIESNDDLLKEGLLAGTLSGYWALANFDERTAKLSYGGTKKIDGREHYRLSYYPKRGSDVSITLFFDKETFRHTRTEYSRTASASIGRNIDDSARQSETRIKVTETFSKFEEAEGLILPHSYKLNYLTVGAHGNTEVEWDYELNSFIFNEPLEDSVFDAHRQ